jgi:hypothetical protein
MAGSTSTTLLGLAWMKRNSHWRRLENWTWRAKICFASYGVVTTIRVTEPAALVPIKLRLPPGWREIKESADEPEYSLVVGNESLPPGLQHLHLLFRAGMLIAAAYKLEPVLGALESELDRRIAMNAAGDHIFIRAGAVGWRGHAIVLGGSEQSERSVLIAGLLRAGASYYSDRYAVLDLDGRLHPYARPLWLSSGAQDYPVRYLPEDLGARTGVHSLPVRTVVFADYRSGAGPKLYPLTRSAAAAQLMANAVSRQVPGSLIQESIAKTLAQAWTLEGVCDEAESTLNLLLGRQRRRHLKVLRKHSPVAKPNT